MFERFADSAIAVLQSGREECLRQEADHIRPEHILVALTEEIADIPARVLASMGVDKAGLQKEVERLRAAAAEETAGRISEEACLEGWNEPRFSDEAIACIRRAADYCLFFGSEQVLPEHLLLGIVDQSTSAAVSVLEEVGTNLTFLRRQVMHRMAEDACFHQTAPSLSTALANGLKYLVSAHLEATETLLSLAGRAGTSLHYLPGRAHIVHMVCVGYMPDFLAVQVAFQRYLLEENLKLLAERTGPLDQEITASLVSSSAQHLRSEARYILEQLWTHEYRLFDQMLDEAEHDLIGSVIEDLWWAQGEEIALHELFDEALDDHRRKQVLSLQKRRLEISQRISKLRTRLTDTIRQCFVKRSISA
jgi:ATP-dependent Clp protease ATP-binding subunit ClpA